jgi:membrane-associated phospholipid phosphatase
MYIAIALFLGIADLFYRDPLYAFTLDVVPPWQAQFTRDSFMVKLTRAVTYLGEGYAAAVIFGIAFCVTSRDKAFYILFVHAVATTVNKNLKIIYRNPRPYMVSSELIAFGCPKSFGNPSGHSSLSACLYTSMFLLFFHDHVDHYKEYRKNQSFMLAAKEPLIGRHTNGEEKPVESENGIFTKIKYFGCLLLVIITVLCVGLSRVALGVHSFNQILYGWSYGVWLAFFLFHYARPPL